MKASEPMIAEEGQFSPFQEEPFEPTTVHALEQQKSLTYKAIRWNHKQQNSQRLLELQIVISEQLPQLPSEYIHKVISNKNHTSLVMILHGRVIGGTTCRLFQEQSLAQLVFFAIDHEYQGRGFGNRLMEILKEFLNSQSIQHILTYADDTARVFFKKQGFSRNIILSKSSYHGLIKQYSGSKLMQCSISPSINYIIADQIIEKHKNYINQQIKNICIVQVLPKKRLLAAIKQKKGFLDSMPNITLHQLVKKLHGLERYSSRAKDLNLKVSIWQECKELMYQIMSQPQTASFHLDKYFYEKVPDEQNQLKGVSFPTIFRNIENQEYANLTEFIQDLNSFILLIQDKYKEGEKKQSAIKLVQFLHAKIENLRYLEEILTVKQPELNRIQQQKSPLNKK